MNKSHKWFTLLLLAGAASVHAQVVSLSVHVQGKSESGALVNIPKATVRMEGQADASERTTKVSGLATFKVAPGVFDIVVTQTEDHWATAVCEVEISAATTVGFMMRKDAPTHECSATATPPVPADNSDAKDVVATVTGDAPAEDVTDTPETTQTPQPPPLPELRPVSSDAPD